MNSNTNQQHPNARSSSTPHPMTPGQQQQQLYQQQQMLQQQQAMLYHQQVMQSMSPEQQQHYVASLRAAQQQPGHLQQGYYAAGGFPATIGSAPGGQKYPNAPAGVSPQLFMATGANGAAVRSGGSSPFPRSTMMPSPAGEIRPSPSSAHHRPSGTPASTPSHPPPSKKSKRVIADRSLPRGLETLLPEAALYNELVQVEERLDAVMSRKKYDLNEKISTHPKIKRTLRIFLSNMASDQYEEPPLDSSMDGSSQPNSHPAAWTFRIEGRILEVRVESDLGLPSCDATLIINVFRITTKKPPNTRKPTVYPKFSALLKSLIVEVHNTDDAESPFSDSPTLIEWTKTAPGSQPDSDGFEVKRRGASDVSVRILLTLDTPSSDERLVLSPALANVLDMHLDTLPNIALALWTYISSNKLAGNDVQDKRLIQCDEALSYVFNVTSFVPSQIPELLRQHTSPEGPITLDYTIKVDRDYNSSLVAYDVEVELDDPSLDRLKASVFASSPADPNGVAPLRRELAMLDDRIASLITSLHMSKVKRDFCRAFAADPVGFIRDWVHSQSRDLDIVFGAASPDMPIASARLSVEQGRRGVFYDTAFAQAAIYHYLNQKDY